MDTIHGLIQTYLDSNDSEVLLKILEEVKTTEHLWTVLVRATNNFYLDEEQGKATAYLFSDKEYADNFVREVKWAGLQSKVLDIKPEQRGTFFSDLYRSGFEAVMIDKGEDSLVMALLGIIEKPEESESTIMNPSLVRAANLFEQAIAGKRAIRQMQDAVSLEIYKAKFLVPVEASSTEAVGRHLVDKTEKQPPALLRSQDSQKFLPVFTDWNEFARYDKHKNHNAVLMGFSELKKVVRKLDGVTINPLGFNLILDQIKFERIEAVNAGQGSEQGDKIISLKDRR